MAVFYNFPHWLKGLRKTKKRRNCTRKNHIEKTSYLVPVRGCPYYVIPDRAAGRGGWRGHSGLLQYYPAVNDVKS